MHSKKYGIPAVAIVGSMGQGAERIYDSGIDSILTTVNAPMELHAAPVSYTHLSKAVLEKNKPTKTITIPLVKANVIAVCTVSDIFFS